MIAQGAYITDSDWHDIYDRSAVVGKKADVWLGNNVWIGDSALVCKGVSIGDNSVIGAGSVVVHDIPPNVVAAGNPASVIKKIDIKRLLRTRGDWYADPGKLVSQFNEIDRHSLKGNTVFGWIRSVLLPRRGD
jgi:carbonic anhydrase/acetyltransferase-like protein (isoleucine patch superfamily)